MPRSLPGLCHASQQPGSFTWHGSHPETVALARALEAEHDALKAVYDATIAEAEGRGSAAASMVVDPLANAVDHARAREPI